MKTEKQKELEYDLERCHTEVERWTLISSPMEMTGSVDELLTELPERHGDGKFELIFRSESEKQKYKEELENYFNSPNCKHSPGPLMIPTVNAKQVFKIETFNWEKFREALSSDD